MILKYLKKKNKISFGDYFFNYCCNLRLESLNKRKFFFHFKKKNFSSFFVRLMGGGNKYREFTHLKFKKKFFNYKINVLLKNKSNSLNLKLFNYHLVRNNYVKV